MKSMTKKGMASLYLAAFTTLLFGIITLSFTSVMIGESKEAQNSDLSQSAYDSALAGIEDAKTALVIYKRCLLNPESGPYNGLTCTNIIQRMEEGWESGSCDVVSRVLNRTPDEGEQRVGVDSSEQAYTCVTIANDTLDYKSTLSEGSRVAIIPILTSGTEFQRVTGIELKWHSLDADDNYEDDKFFVDKTNPSKQLAVSSNVYTDLYTKGVLPFGTKADATETIPILSFELFQTDGNFRMGDLDLVNDSGTGTDHAMMMLYPADNTNRESGKYINSTSLISTSNKTSTTARTSNAEGLTPTAVTCGYTEGYRCRTVIGFPGTYGGGPRAKNTFFLKLSLPYGVPSTDFSVRLCTEIVDGSCASHTDFVGAQAIVDSTGRASTLYRRVVARVNTANSNALFPEFAIASSDQIEKQFYVTNNCWLTDGEGNSSLCANNGDAPVDL
ncbi:hypothetical protein IJ114_01175 [Candidatus Saccharibacteria bacterium]|nr:hypothetical protein [Candidatus Saccharibacteria bacterium]